MGQGDVHFVPFLDALKGSLSQFRFCWIPGRDDAGLTSLPRERTGGASLFYGSLSPRKGQRSMRVKI